MVTALICLWVSSGFQEGDRWTTERTLQVVSSDEKVDSTTKERVQYRVVRVEAALFAIQTDIASASYPKAKPITSITVFKPNGALISNEDTIDLNLERIRRMEWTALEERKGISWSRSWPSRSSLIEAKVIVKPTARTQKDTTLSIIYQEAGITRGTGTIKILNDVPVIEELSVTLKPVEVPGSTKPGRLTVSETLKEIHIGSN